MLAYCAKGKSPLDLSRLIISSPQPEFVSTDPDPDCGGYSTKGFIYLIEFSQLENREWNDFVLGIKIDFKVNSFVPKLFLDTSSLFWAKIIALKHFGATKEVTFLTGIPSANIVAYKKSGDNSFMKM